MSIRIANQDAHSRISRRAPFIGSNFSGEAHTPGRYVYTGQLPGRFGGENGPSHADYVVLSYSTPIAWHLPGDGWVIPDVSYSVTTAKHQGYAHRGAGYTYSEHQERTPWSYGLTGRQAQVLRSVRNGRTVGPIGVARRTLAAVVATGEAAWYGNSIVKA